MARASSLCCRRTVRCTQMVCCASRAQSECVCALCGDADDDEAAEVYFNRKCSALLGDDERECATRCDGDTPALAHKRTLTHSPLPIKVPVFYLTCVSRRRDAPTTTTTTSFDVHSPQHSRPRADNISCERGEAMTLCAKSA